MIVDSGACSSIGGKRTLDAVISKLKIEKVENAEPSRDSNRFGASVDDHKTMFAVRFPFLSTDNEADPLFKIQFNVIEGDLPFLVGLPTLIAVKSSVKFNTKWLGFRSGDEFVKILLEKEKGHLILPFRATPKKDDRRKINQEKSNYYIPFVGDDDPEED